MRSVLVALVLLLATLPVRAAPEGPPAPGSTVLGDGVVVPGQRVGPLRLTMPLPQIIETVGPGYKREEFKEEKIILYEWRAQGIWVSQDTRTMALRVISAFGADSRYHTDRGVRLLELFSRAEKVYGKDYKRWEFKEEKVILIRYAALGLQFGLVNDPAQALLIGRIFQIGIFKPGDLPPARQP
jgi:hypothetical protein